MHLIVVEIFQSGPKFPTNSPTKPIDVLCYLYIRNSCRTRKKKMQKLLCSFTRSQWDGTRNLQNSSPAETLDGDGFRRIWAGNTQCVGTLRPKAWAKESEAICAEKTWQGILPPTTALVTAGEVRCLIFHLRQPHLLWFSLSNKGIFHRSLGCFYAISQLDSETENSPIRLLWPRTL